MLLSEIMLPFLMTTLFLLPLCLFASTEVRSLSYKKKAPLAQLVIPEGIQNMEDPWNETDGKELPNDSLISPRDPFHFSAESPNFQQSKQGEENIENGAGHHQQERHGQLKGERAEEEKADGRTTIVGEQIGKGEEAEAKGSVGHHQLNETRTKTLKIKSPSNHEFAQKIAMFEKSNDGPQMGAGQGQHSALQRVEGGLGLSSPLKMTSFSAPKPNILAKASPFEKANNDQTNATGDIQLEGLKWNCTESDKRCRDWRLLSQKFIEAESMDQKVELIYFRDFSARSGEMPTCSKKIGPKSLIRMVSLANAQLRQVGRISDTAPISKEDCLRMKLAFWENFVEKVEAQMSVSNEMLLEWKIKLRKSVDGKMIPVPEDVLPLACVNEHGEPLTLAALRQTVNDALRAIEEGQQPPKPPRWIEGLQQIAAKWEGIFNKLDHQHSNILFNAEVKPSFQRQIDLNLSMGGQPVTDLYKLMALATHLKKNFADKKLPILILPPKDEDADKGLVHGKMNFFQRQIPSS